MADNTEEQDFPLLEALAKISARDFRLGQFMSDIGLDPNQTNLFYRQLIKEAKEIMSHVDTLENTINSEANVINQLRANLEASQERARVLTIKVRGLQNGTSRKSEALDNEVRQLAADSARLQAKVLRYDALVQLLSGEIEPTTLKALSNLFWDMHTEALNAKLDGRPPPDPAVLEKARQELRQELRDILRIPPEKLEKEIAILRAEAEKLQKNNEVVTMLYYGLRQQGWVDTGPGETEEPQENNEAPTEEDFMEYLQSLEDKRRNETIEGGG